MLTRAELLILNRVINQIYSVKDFDKMRRNALTDLQSLLMFTSGEIHVKCNEDGHMIDGGVGIGEWDDDTSREYFEKFEKIDYARWFFNNNRSTIIRESDMFEENEKESTPYYQGFMKKHNFHHCMQASITKNEEFLGLIALYRDKAMGDFDEKDRFVIVLLLPHLENRFAAEGIGNQKSGFDGMHYMDQYMLTPRELQVLKLLLDGLTPAEICDSLVISSHTLNKHTSSIYSKLGINHRWELIKFK